MLQVCTLSDLQYDVYHASVDTEGDTALQVMSQHGPLLDLIMEAEFEALRQPKSTGGAALSLVTKTAVAMIVPLTWV